MGEDKLQAAVSREQETGSAESREEFERGGGCPDEAAAAALEGLGMSGRATYGPRGGENGSVGDLTRCG